MLLLATSTFGKISNEKLYPCELKNPKVSTGEKSFNVSVPLADENKKVHYPLQPECSLPIAKHSARDWPANMHKDWDSPLRNKGWLDRVSRGRRG